jgi:EAL domain-containing protein (putative c-di-GMP-specific phosphodiesterase class I)
VVLGEGVETAAEYRVLRAMGINLLQGYLFAKPGLESLPVVPAEVWESLE